MGKALRKIGKFYSSIIMGNIGIFIFVGLLSVMFQKQGWFPNENIYAISQLAYTTVLPVCIGYVGGERIGGNPGGVLAVLVVAGILTANSSIGLLTGMLAGPVAGVIWKYVQQLEKKYVKSSMQMLVRNLTIGICGGILAVTGYYFVAPALKGITVVISGGVDYLVAKGMLGIVSLIIEPAKVFFLNNIINHGILVPLAMNQVQEMGSSSLFLLEANPGPGLGMLAALYCFKKEKKEEYLSAMVAHGAGGLHEVYFPFVLSNLWLLLPVMAAGVAGTWWFQLSGAGLTVPVSPGSVITLLLLAGKGETVRVAAGMGISAAVAFAGSILVLRMQGSKAQKTTMQECEMLGEKTKKIVQEAEKMSIHKIGFICDAGMGSSVMGAALFRRKLAQNHVEGIQAEAFAADQIPDGLDLLVCQKDFLHLIPDKAKETECYTVENFVSGEAYGELMKLINQRNR